MNQDANKTRVGNMGAAMSLGLVLGGLFGLVVDNMIIFAGEGLILGLAS